MEANVAIQQGKDKSAGEPMEADAAPHQGKDKPYPYYGRGPALQRWLG